MTTEMDRNKNTRKKLFLIIYKTHTRKNKVKINKSCKIHKYQSNQNNQNNKILKKKKRKKNKLKKNLKLKKTIFHLKILYGIWI